MMMVLSLCFGIFVVYYCLMFVTGFWDFCDGYVAGFFEFYLVTGFVRLVIGFVFGILRLC